jgi:UDP-N-acetyl-D-galactosamine dehydrogenase
MGMFVANKVVKLMIQKGASIKGSKALILGITFKENCPDIRNSKVIDVYRELLQFGLDVDIYDPFADKEEVFHEYGIKLCDTFKTYDSVILAVSHDSFLNLDFDKLKKDTSSVIFDTKACLVRDIVDSRL